MRPRVRSPVPQPPQRPATSRLPQPMVLVPPARVPTAVTMNAAIAVNPATLPNGTVGVCLLTNSQCNGRQWFVYIQCLCRQLASGTVAECSHGCDHRYTDHGSHQQLHDHRNRWSGCDRCACLRRDDQCGDHRESGDVAEWNGRNCLLADGQCNGWQRVHIRSVFLPAACQRDCR